MQIYVVTHKTYENTNEFYIDLQKAQERLMQMYREEKLINIDARLDDYKIITLDEGKPFMAAYLDDNQSESGSQ